MGDLSEGKIGVRANVQDKSAGKDFMNQPLYPSLDIRPQCLTVYTHRGGFFLLIPAVPYCRWEYFSSFNKSKLADNQGCRGHIVKECLYYRYVLDRLV
jgi:hypothetical protein